MSGAALPALALATLWLVATSLAALLIARGIPPSADDRADDRPDGEPGSRR